MTHDNLQVVDIFFKCYNILITFMILIHMLQIVYGMFLHVQDALW